VGRKSRAKRQQRQSERSSSRLSEHERKGKKLTPPLLALPGGVYLTDWPVDHLPELLWIAAMQHEYEHPTTSANAVLDVLDRFVDGDDIVDGRISSFAFVPESRRADARAALRRAARDETAPALPDDLGHALTLYPECPALWLYADWQQQHHADPERGTGLLRRLLEANFSSGSESATHLRAVPLGRWAYHGKFRATKEVFDQMLWPRYPGGLDEDERNAAQAEMRAMYGALANPGLGAGGEREPTWAAYFWRQSYRVSACDLSAPQRASLDRLSGERREETDESARDLESDIGSLRIELLRGWEQLAEALRTAQLRLEFDLYEPTADEVRLGLASRQMRLLRLMFSDPHLWVSSAGPHVLRSMVDVLITSRWLLLQNNAELYARYRLYGLGHTKLYKQHLEDHADAFGTSDETDQLLRTLQDEIDVELGEEFVEIDLGANFAGVTLRQMAEAVDETASDTATEDVALKSLYTLAYAPFSGESHGEWGSLARFDLRRCRNPLHRYHRLARFDVVMQTPQMSTLDFAIDVTERTVCAIFRHYGVDVQDDFDRLRTVSNESSGAES
jgi:hypothetical protein